MAERKVKKPSRFVTKTLRRAKINNVKCYLKEVQVKQFRNPDNIWSEIVGKNTAYYLIVSSDGVNRKELSREGAEIVYNQVIEFEKKQLKIEAL